MVTLRNSQWIEAGQEAELSYTLAGSSSANNQVQLEVSRIPSVDISRRFDFLYNYQHHCTEQLTSKALPLLFVSQFKAVDEQEAEKIKANVQELSGRYMPASFPTADLYTGRATPSPMNGSLLTRVCS